MLAKRIIPCLDVKDGRVVKGVNFVGLQDAGDPVEIAMRYDEEDADEITFLDITASYEKRGIILDVVKETARRVFLPLTVGGGIRSIEDIRALLGVGADKVSINTAAAYNPNLIAEGAEKFGSQCIVVAIDARRVRENEDKKTTLEEHFKNRGWETIWERIRLNKDSKFEVYTHGGRNPTGIDAVRWGKLVEELGAGEILLTSMDRDGTKMGYDLELTREISTSVKIPLIASGGAGNLEHLYEGFVEGKADAVLAASIFHYREYTIREAKEYLKNRGIPVRL